MRRPPARAVRLFVPVALMAVGPLAAQGPRTIGVGQIVADSLTARDPVGRSRRSPYHVWTLDGRRGQRLVLDLVAPDFDAYLVLRDQEGYVVGSDDDSGDERNSRLHAILPRDGRYRVVATAFGEDGRGPYTLSVGGWEAPAAPAAGAAASLRPGETKDGLLEPGDEATGDGPFEDRWTLDARAGERLRIEMRSDHFDSYLTVLGPEGQAVGSDDDGLGDRDAVVTMRAAAAGRYTVFASSYGESPTTGAYRIAVVEEGGDFAEPGMAAAIAPGETREGRLETGDPLGTRGLEDRWTFTGRAGQVVRVDAISSAFDSYAVLTFGETPVDSNDDGGDGNNARLMTVLPNSGTYTIVVSAFTEGRSGGRYTLALEASGPPPPAGQTARIAPGQRLAGRLEPDDRSREGGGNEDLWEFDGRAGQEVMIELRSGAFDTYLQLVAPDGRSVAENDDGLGDGTDSFIMAALARSGRHRIVVRGFGDREARGLYELGLSLGGAISRPGQVGEIQPGETLLGRLESGDSTVGDSTYADIYRFRPARAGEVTIDLRSSDFDAYLIFQDASARTLATDDDSGTGTDARITARVSAGVTYRIVANSYGEERETGMYRLAVRLTP